MRKRIRVSSETAAARQRRKIAEAARLVILEKCENGFFYVGPKSRELLRVARLYGKGQTGGKIARHIRRSERTVRRRIKTLKDLSSKTGDRVSY